MVNILKTILLLLVINLYAQDKKHYIGFGGALTRANTHTIDKENMTDITVKYGYSLYDLLDLELRGSFYIAGGEKLYHPSSIGIFLKPNLDLTKYTNIYTLIGYSKNTLSKQDTRQINAVTIQEDYSFGGGFEYNFFKNISGYIDYVNYIDKSVTKPEGTYAIKIDSLSIGVNYRFGIEAINDKNLQKESKLEKTYIDLSKQKNIYQLSRTKPIKRGKTTFYEFKIYDDMKEQK